MPSVTLVGGKEANVALKIVRENCEEIGKRTAFVGTKWPYGYGMETGRHRKSGKLARRAGGAWYLTRAAVQIDQPTEADVAWLARPRKTEPALLRAVGRIVIRHARPLVPVRTGRLRKSLKTWVQRI